MASSSKSLKEYLKRYEGINEEEKKKKKKKKQKSKSEAMGFLVVDEDPTWQKPVNLEEDNDNNSTDEDKPFVDEDIEIKRMRRLEALRAKRPFNAISEDGSGWVPVGQSSPPKISSSDISPPRRQRINSEPGSMSPGDRGEDVDLSPPRQRRKRHHTPSPEPATNQDQLPTDLSPTRKSRNVDSDLSPPRKSRKDVDRDLSPPRKSRKDVDRDLSPPRKSRKDVDRDLSPPRKSRKDVDRDLSPPRKSRKDVDRDLSPPRKSRKDVDRDLSPPRKSRKDVDLSPPRKKKQVPPDSLKEQPKVGLISGREMRDEITRTKKDERLRFQQMDPSISGREAVPVYRDKKTGERISKEELLKSQRKVEEKPKEIKLEWGKGLAQKREAETNLEELELEKEKPFARTRDDPDLDKMLKERVRWGDPMAHLVKKKYSEPVLPDLGDSEKMKESGFIIPQEIPNHSWLKRGLDAAPNRYGIRPGRHWDGIDRSNGFEKGMFKRKNDKQATEAEAYLWSVADM
ncbi:BUD13 homolog [Prunus avium]|uniref:BUD13 homolog n=1 Tax=Prunus avium TaxID=42229 RepID=A0A6P5TU93_PRUAV|nr:BUD13 homolog [Prunus avium]